MENGNLRELLQVEEKESRSLRSLPWPAQHWGQLERWPSSTTAAPQRLSSTGTSKPAASTSTPPWSPDYPTSDYPRSTATQQAAAAAAASTAPELLGNGNRDDPTMKCDVYGFGVVLLELVMAKKGTGWD